MKKSDDIKELATALSKAQGEIKGAVTDSTNPFYKSKYADLSSVWFSVSGPLAKHGLSVVQTNSPHENGVEVETTLLHASGQWISGSLFMPAEKMDPQTFGKLMTYARRYSLAALLSVPTIDDDGEEAMGRGSVPEVKAVTEVPPKAEKPKAVQKPACDHKWLVSKFNQNEEYCARGKETGCKEKRPRKVS